jgi:predicted ester cyclase
MSTEDNKTFIHRYFEALSGKDKATAVVNSYVTDEELKHHIAFYEAAFPNYELIAEDMIAEGDKVVVRSTFRGTHKGDLMGIAPTGKQVTMPLILIYRIADDKIVEHWMQADALGMLQQLGVIPPMGQAS